MIVACSPHANNSLEVPASPFNRHGHKGCMHQECPRVEISLKGRGARQGSDISYQHGTLVPELSQLRQRPDGDHALPNSKAMLSDMLYTKACHGRLKACCPFMHWNLKSLAGDLRTATPLVEGGSLRTLWRRPVSLSTHKKQLGSTCQDRQ